MIWNTNTLTFQDIVGNFSAAIRLDPYKDIVWRLGEIVVKFGNHADLCDEKRNADILGLLGEKTLCPDILPIAEDEINRLGQDYRLLSTTVLKSKEALVMPYFPHPTLDQYYLAEPDRDRKIELGESLALLHVPYAIMNFTDRHLANVMLNPEDKQLVTIDTPEGIFNNKVSRYYDEMPYRGRRDDVVLCFNANENMAGIIPRTLDVREQQLTACHNTIALIQEKADALNCFHENLADDLLFRSNELRDYLEHKITQISGREHNTGMSL